MESGASEGECDDLNSHGVSGIVARYLGHVSSCFRSVVVVYTCLGHVTSCCFTSVFAGVVR